MTPGERLDPVDWKIEVAALAMAGAESWDGYDEAFVSWYRERARRALVAVGCLSA